MNVLIAYDAEADMGYISLLKNARSAETVDIGETLLSADIDHDNRVIGIEFTGEAAPEIARLGSLTGKKRKLESVFSDGKRVRRFMVHDSAETAIFIYGIRFYFADRACRHFVGFDIFDQEEKSE